MFLPALLVLMGRRLGKVTPSPEGDRVLVSPRPGRDATSRRGRSGHRGRAPAPRDAPLGIRWSGIDASVLPTGQSARTVSDAITRDFPGADSAPVILALSAPAAAGPALRNYAAGLDRMSGVYHVSGRATSAVTPGKSTSMLVVRRSPNGRRES